MVLQNYFSGCKKNIRIKSVLLSASHIEWTVFGFLQKEILIKQHSKHHDL